jgi:DNA-binding response OmpR family regulator
MPKPSVLIVESDGHDRESLVGRMQQLGFATTTAVTGLAALRLLRDTGFDIVITALQLTGEADGLRVARAVRWRWPRTLVIVAAADKSFESAVAAINIGVDGYMLKPLEAVEVQEAIDWARWRLEARCRSEQASHLVRQQGLTLDCRTSQVYVDGERVELTPTEAKILRCLMQNPDRVISSQELFEVSHRAPADDTDNVDDTVRRHIYNLRHKIEPDPKTTRYINNIYGVGYTFGGARDEETVGAERMAGSSTGGG